MIVNLEHLEIVNIVLNIEDYDMKTRTSFKKGHKGYWLNKSLPSWMKKKD